MKVLCIIAGGVFLSIAGVAIGFVIGRSNQGMHNSEVDSVPVQIGVVEQLPHWYAIYPKGNDEIMGAIELDSRQKKVTSISSAMSSNPGTYVSVKVNYEGDDTVFSRLTLANGDKQYVDYTLDGTYELQFSDSNSKPSAVFYDGAWRDTILRSDSTLFLSGETLYKFIKVNDDGTVEAEALESIDEE